MLISVKPNFGTGGMLELLKKINEEQRQLEADIMKLGSMIRSAELEEPEDTEKSELES